MSNEKATNKYKKLAAAAAVDQLKLSNPDVISLIKDWVDSLSEADRETKFVWFGGSIKLKDIPRKAEQDPEFREEFLSQARNFHTFSSEGGQ